VASAQERSQICVVVLDEYGASIPKSKVAFIPISRSASQGMVELIANDEGRVDTEMVNGVYKIRIKADSYKKVILKDQRVPFASQQCIEVKLRSAIPPHPIT